MPDEKRIISKSKLDAIAVAIREKTGSDSTYTPDQMVTAIGAIETQGDYQEKTFTENGTYTPDAGYDAFSQVTVNVQSSGSNPLQDMLDRSSDTDGSYLFYAYNSRHLFYRLTYEILATLDFSNKHYTKAPYIFYNCAGLTTIPQLDFSSVTDASFSFYGCTGLTTIPQLDFSSLRGAYSLFQDCASLTTIPQLDFSSVKNAGQIFMGCSGLTTVSQLDFSSVTDATRMFQNCSGLTTVSQLDFSSVTNASAMFSSCSNLTTIPQLTFGSLTITGDMFYNCNRLTEVSQFNLSKVTSAGGMFYGCSSLTAIPQLDLSNVTSTSYMFYNCSRLTTLDFSNIKTIGSSFAQGASSLSTLIIRNTTTLATLESTNAFTNTPITNGTGYIYVPDDLVDRYKQATNWVYLADYIKPLSELPQGE